MTSPLKATEALVLSRKDSGEHHMQLTLFSRDSGLITGMQRVSRSSRNRKSATADLFDHIRANLKFPKSGESGLYFIEEMDVLQRFSGIGQNYRKLNAAVDYARILIRNASHLEDHERIFQRAQQLFRALEASALPHVAVLKAFYLFLREEGYPVKEDWWKSLSPGDRTTAAALLTRPLKEIELSPDATEPEHLLDSLRSWVRAQTDILA